MNKDKLKKIYITILAIYVAIVTAFYFISGEQLRYKESNNNIEMMEADSITPEMVGSTVISQNFLNTLDKIESIEIVFTKGYTEGIGRYNIDLLDNGLLLARKTIDAIDIPEQHRTYLDLTSFIEYENKQELTLKIYPISSEAEYISVMMNSTADSVISVNNEQINGTLCFAVKGSETISSSSYYWLIVGAIGLGIGIYLFKSYKDYLKNKNDYLVAGLAAVYRYEFLISQLVSRDFKSKYKRSIFGIFWSFLNPLLTMTVQFLVFSTFFSSDTKNYPVYLIVGVVCFSFFSECTTMCLSSISANYRLITKVYMPKYIFPLSKAISSTVNLLISLIPLILVAIITGTSITPAFLLMFYFLLCLIVFSLGVGMVLATLMVFFRDIQFLWTVICTIWQYATPIFYPAEIIPEKYRFVVKFNPLYHFIGNARKCLIDGISPEPISYVYSLVFALLSIGIGSYVFKKAQDKFTLYL